MFRYEVAQRFDQLAANNAQLVQRVSGTYASLADRGPCRSSLNIEEKPA